MIKTARQPKDRIRNLSREGATDTQILLQDCMMEHFLERISISEYRDEFILKGGMLVSAMIGLASRSAIDIDTTMKGETLGIDEAERIIAIIIAVPVDDSVESHIKRASKIMDEAECPGVRVSMEIEFDGVRTLLKIDISTGDVIIPREVRYSFKFMSENRSIDIQTYNLETILIEKLETVISRATTDAHMRGLYDLHVLHQLYGRELIPVSLHIALMVTTKKRGAGKYLSDVPMVFDEVEADFDIEKQQKSYQKRFPYAASLIWEVIMASVRDIYKRTEA